MPLPPRARRAARVALVAALALACPRPADARPRRVGPLITRLLTRPEIMPGQWVRLDRNEACCTLGLDDLAAVHARLTFRF